jgi:hypothetical protein
LTKVELWEICSGRYFWRYYKEFILIWVIRVFERLMVNKFIRHGRDKIQFFFFLVLTVARHLVRLVGKCVELEIARHTLSELALLRQDGSDLRWKVDFLQFVALMGMSPKLLNFGTDV